MVGLGRKKELFIDMIKRNISHASKIDPAYLTCVTTVKRENGHNIDF